MAEFIALQLHTDQLSIAFPLHTELLYMKTGIGLLIMSNWQTELTKGIEDYIRKFEDADEHVRNRPRIKREYDQAVCVISPRISFSVCRIRNYYYR